MDAQISDAHITVDGLRIHYLTAGSSGSPVLLLHGAGLDAARLSYEPSISALARQHIVFAPDWPGQGASDKPRIDYTLDRYISLLGGLLDALGLSRASLVGLSLGGGAALGFALQSPQRVERLVLVDSYGLGKAIPWGILGYLLVRLPGLNALGWASLRRSRRMLRLSLQSIVHNRQAINDELVDQVYELLQQPNIEWAFTSLQRHETLPGGLRSDFSDRLHTLTVPTLIIHGAHDRAVPITWARRAQQRIAGSTLRVFANSGHWTPREEPDEFAQVVALFLAAH
jgi:pimeloyl-ACP methyl ester carboxylesterase